MGMSLSIVLSVNLLDIIELSAAVCAKSRSRSAAEQRHLAYAPQRRLLSRPAQVSLPV
jgi:hypothetical protein